MLLEFILSVMQLLYEEASIRDNTEFKGKDYPLSSINFTNILRSKIISLIYSNSQRVALPTNFNWDSSVFCVFTLVHSRQGDKVLFSHARS